MARNWHRRRKSPIRRRSVVMTVLSALSVLALFALVFGTLPTGGRMRWAGVISFLLMFMDLFFFVIGLRDFRDNTFNTAVRLLAVCVPGLAFAIYILVYMTGILVG